MSSSIHEEIVQLKKRMARVNLCFHPWRNNMRTVNRFYSEFIAIFGYDKWDTVLPQIRVAWEAARLDFDKMLGLIRGWQQLEQFFTVEKTASSEETQTIAELIDNLAKSIQSINELKRLVKVSEVLQADAEAIAADKELLHDLREVMKKYASKEQKEET